MVLRSSQPAQNKTALVVAAGDAARGGRVQVTLAHAHAHGSRDAHARADEGGPVGTIGPASSASSFSQQQQERGNAGAAVDSGEDDEPEDPNDEEDAGAGGLLDLDASQRRALRTLAHTRRRRRAQDEVMKDVLFAAAASSSSYSSSASASASAPSEAAGTCAGLRLDEFMDPEERYRRLKRLARKHHVFMSLLSKGREDGRNPPPPPPLGAGLGAAGVAAGGGPGVAGAFESHEALLMEVDDVGADLLDPETVLQLQSLNAILTAPPVPPSSSPAAAAAAAAGSAPTSPVAASPTAGVAASTPTGLSSNVAIPSGRSADAAGAPSDAEVQRIAEELFLPPLQGGSSKSVDVILQETITKLPRSSFASNSGGGANFASANSGSGNALTAPKARGRDPDPASETVLIPSSTASTSLFSSTSTVTSLPLHLRQPKRYLRDVRNRHCPVNVRFMETNSVWTADRFANGGFG